MNPYEILGINKGATEEEIKKAYRRMVSQYHPDVFWGDKSYAAEKLNEATEAYQMLKASGFHHEETQQHDFHKEEPQHYQKSTKSTPTWKWTPYNSKQTVHSGSSSSDKESPFSSGQKIGIYAMGLIIAAVLILCIGTFGSRDLREIKNSITTLQSSSSESILNSNAVIVSMSESRPTDAEAIKSWRSPSRDSNSSSYQSSVWDETPEIDTVSEAMDIIEQARNRNAHNGGADKPANISIPEMTATPSDTYTPNSKLEQSNNEVYMVYITDSGTKYHRQSCQYLAHSAYCVAISYAQDHGYEPCSRCNP